MAEVESAERCPICPADGPPTRQPRPQPPSQPQHSESSTSTSFPAVSSNDKDIESESGEAGASDELVWIACSKCDTWYHSTCLLLDPVNAEVIIPAAIRSVLGQHEGEWTNWTVWVDRWYCKDCIGWCTSPDNPRPPRHVYKATLKAGCPPKSSTSNGHGSSEKEGSARGRRTLDNPSESPVPNKRARLSSSVSGAHGDREDTSTIDDIARVSAGLGDSAGGAGRPKRKAAENAPDYRAWNHGIPTPTNNWLRLIEDPKKYGADIRVGNFPRLKGGVLSKEWLESIRDQSEEARREGTNGGESKVRGGMRAGLRNGHQHPDQDAETDAGGDTERSVKEEDEGDSDASMREDHERPSPELFYGLDRRPILVRPEDGGIESMGGKLPDKKLRVTDVAELVGRNVTVDVIDVATQSSIQWNLGKWAEYFTASSDPAWNGKVYNIISLEITGSALAKKVTPPKLVREIDWVDNFWQFDTSTGRRGKHSTAMNGVNGTDAARAPSEANGAAANGSEAHSAGDAVSQNGLAGEAVGQGATGWAQDKARPGSKWPKVQLYCLMGIRGSWTDWHVDFAASSVYYSIHTGSKEFYFIKPTEHNLKAYTTWSGSAELQQTKWLGDMCEGGVEKIRLHAGDTMIIPSGYIHAVYTPENSIVFGGNFLHSYNISTQLRLRTIEIETKVPQRFRFPMLEKLCWYVAERYCADLRTLRVLRLKPTTPASGLKPHSIVLRELRYLIEFLQGQVDMLENTELEEKKRKLVFDRIPGEVKDPAGLVRDLKWRVERELPEGERVAAAEVKGGEKGRAEVVKEEVLEKEGKAGSKRSIKDKVLPPGSRTTSLKSRPWDGIENPESMITRTRQDLPRPSLPGGHDENIKPAEDVPAVTTAAVTEEISKQSKRRTYGLVDGSTVLEEVEVVHTQRQMIWPPVMPAPILGT